MFSKFKYKFEILFERDLENRTTSFLFPVFKRASAEDGAWTDGWSPIFPQTFWHYIIVIMSMSIILSVCHLLLEFRISNFVKHFLLGSNISIDNPQILLKQLIYTCKTKLWLLYLFSFLAESIYSHKTRSMDVWNV